MFEDDALLRFSAQAVWDQDLSGLPSERIQVQGHPRFDFDAPRRANEVELDHCFAQWSGVAELQRLQHGLTVRVAADPVLSHLVVYRPAGQPWICTEPVSHATGAFSLDRLHAGLHGRRWLPPNAACARPWKSV